MLKKEDLLEPMKKKFDDLNYRWNIEPTGTGKIKTSCNLPIDVIYFRYEDKLAERQIAAQRQPALCAFLGIYPEFGLIGRQQRPSFF